MSWTIFISGFIHPIQFVSIKTNILIIPYVPFDAHVLEQKFINELNASIVQNEPGCSPPDKCLGKGFNACSRRRMDHCRAIRATWSSYCKIAFQKLMFFCFIRTINLISWVTANLRKSPVQEKYYSLNQKPWFWTPQRGTVMEIDE